MSSRLLKFSLHKKVSKKKLDGAKEISGEVFRNILIIMDIFGLKKKIFLILKKNGDHIE